MTGYLEILGSAWDQPSVDGANTLFCKPEYTSEDWRAFFEGHFETRRMTGPLWDYLAYPIFWWFGDDVHTKLQKALDPVARGQIRDVLGAHGLALGAYLAASTADRDDLRFWLVALWNLGRNGVSSFDRRALFDWTCRLVDSFPALLRSDHVIDPVQHPYVNWVRMQVQYVLCDTLPLTETVKAEISSVVGIAGPERLELWVTHTVLLHDNFFFSKKDLTFLQAYFDAIPWHLERPVGLSVNDALGNSGATGLGTAARSAINTFRIHVEECQTGRWEFPLEVPEFRTDCQAIVTAHEANHIVNGLNIEADPGLRSRQDLLISQAGSDPQNYLRSMLEAGFFVSAPQEFFASIANMYMTNTMLTLEVARVRQLQGRSCPLEQFLFFLDVYSGGSGASRGYLTGTDARVQWYEIPLARDGRGRINGFALGPRTWSVRYDASDRAADLSEAWPRPSDFFSVTPCRVVDTRNAEGALGGPALVAAGTRTFALGGTCGVPAGAAAVSMNVTAADATSAGTLAMYPGTGPVPGTNTLSFALGKNRANNVTLGLIDGVLSVANHQATGSVNLIIDVSGYYR